MFTGLDSLFCMAFKVVQSVALHFEEVRYTTKSVV